MSTSTTAMPSSGSMSTTGMLFERLWRTSGIQLAVLLVVAYLLYGYPPPVGAPVDALVTFYAGNRTRILTAGVLTGMAVLYLMWFAAALRTTLAAAGQEGWGAAAIASSAAVGGLLLLLMGMGAALAYSIAGSGNRPLIAGINDLAWACLVLTSFPRAMLIMASAFGLWRAGLISNALFGAGAAAIVLVLLGGTTWLSGGFWAPDGTYSRFISPLVGLVWIVIVSWVLLTRAPATRSGW